MAAVDREMTVTYAGLSVGGFSTNYLLHGVSDHSVTDGTAESFFQFSVVVVADDETMFASLCRALETAYRTPRKSLTVTLKGAALVHVSHQSASGGFNTDPDIEKPGDPMDSARSRLYRCRVKYETPANTATTSGLRERTVNVDYDASRIRTIRIAGTFTAVPGSTTARARYSAAIAALASSALSGLSVTVSELVGEPVTEEDYDDKVIRFERTYRELIFGQGQDAANDDSGLVDQTLTVARRQGSEERSEGGGSEGGAATASAAAQVKMLSVFDLHYEASVDNTVTTGLKAKYDTIRGWLLGQFNAVFNQSEFALVSETPRFDRVNNRIIVDMTAEGAVDGLDVVRRTFSVSDRVVEAHVLRGVHTGNPLSRFVHRGFAEAFRTVTETYRKLGTVSQSGAAQTSRTLARAFSSAPVGDTIQAGGEWIIIESPNAQVSPITLGIAGGANTLEFSDVSTTVTMQYIKPHTDAASTGSSDRPSSPAGGTLSTDVGLNSQSGTGAGTPGGITAFINRSGP